jgi:hypothetical protein
MKMFKRRAKMARFVKSTTSKTAVAASLAALLLGLTATASNADLWWGGGGWHHGWHYGWHGGGWGPAIGSYAYSRCYQSRPIYDAYGNYVGNQTVNVCQ